MNSTLRLTLRALLAFTLAALGAPAFAGTPRAKVSAVLKSNAVFDPMPSFNEIPAPAPPSVLGSIMPPAPQLWSHLKTVDTLSKEDKEALRRLSSNLPNFNEKMVRVLDLEKALKVIHGALKADPSLNPLRFFTDPGFRRYYAYYLTGETLQGIFHGDKGAFPDPNNHKGYRIRVLAPPDGNDMQGNRFSMRGLLIGQNVIAMLYDRSFVVRQFDHDFKFDEIVVQKIPDELKETLNVSGVYIILGGKEWPVYWLNDKQINVWHVTRDMPQSLPITPNP
ncbi:MAG: hypothetical protein HY552_06245 [Elusimicrobia bacterium]|nr:hypothetical protein [Elusimicrobiota bacterium]